MLHDWDMLLEFNMRMGWPGMPNVPPCTGESHRRKKCPFPDASIRPVEKYLSAPFPLGDTMSILERMEEKRKGEKKEHISRVEI